jgi:hypothetical protein
MACNRDIFTYCFTLHLNHYLLQRDRRVHTVRIPFQTSKWPFSRQISVHNPLSHILAIVLSVVAFVISLLSNLKWFIYPEVPFRFISSWTLGFQSHLMLFPQHSKRTSSCQHSCFIWVFLGSRVRISFRRLTLLATFSSVPHVKYQDTVLRWRLQTHFMTFPICDSQSTKYLTQCSWESVIDKSMNGSR